MQQLAIARPLESGIDLAELWDQLIAGRLIVSNTFHQAGRCFAELEERRPPPGFALPAVEILARFFLGEGQKRLAYDAKVSTGTIAGWCANALGVMAPRQIVSRAPILLVMAAHCRYGMPLQPARLEPVMPGDSMQISCETPGASLGTRLSRSELEVAFLAIEGKKHCEIAKTRNTSGRTTANQLASIFGKLKVSGRAELRSHAITEASLGLARRKAGASAPRAVPCQPPSAVSARSNPDARRRYSSVESSMVTASPMNESTVSIMDHVFMV